MSQGEVTLDQLKEHSLRVLQEAVLQRSGDQLEGEAWAGRPLRKVLARSRYEAISTEWGWRKGPGKSTHCPPN